jgi:hypothetical protein
MGSTSINLLRNCQSAGSSLGTNRWCHPLLRKSGFSFASHTWGSGMLMPGLTQDGDVHIWLYHLYEAMHHCVHNSYDVRLHANGLLTSAQAASEQLEALSGLDCLPPESLALAP